MSRYFVKPDGQTGKEPFPGVRLSTGTGDALTVSRVELEPHAVVSPHSHPHEQMGILIQGTLTFRVGDEVQVLAPGDMWRIPGGVEHTCQAGDTPTIAIDVFTPVREDYR